MYKPQYKQNKIRRIGKKEISKKIENLNRKILSDIIENIYVKENKEIEIKFKERKNENG